MPRYPVPTLLPIALESGQIYLESVVQDPPNASACRGLAIVAHPFGRLGGSLDDPVVSHLASLLLSHAGLRVVRFNSRGVGKSGGSPSWTGKTECTDFQDLVLRCIDNFCLDFPDAVQAQLVIAGYSAGSLYGSTVRVPPSVYDLKQFKDAPKPRYLLVSFPAGVTWALSFFTTKTYTEALKRLLSSRTKPGRGDAPGDEDRGAREESTPSNQAELEPVAAHVLAVYGDQDQFTGIATYDTWSRECSSLAPSPFKPAQAPDSAQPASMSTFHHVLIEKADHFYRSSAALDALDKAVVEWYDALTD